MSCRCKLCPDCMGKAMQAMAELGAIEERLKSKNKQIEELRAEVELHKSEGIIQAGIINELRAEVERLEKKNAKLTIWIENYQEIEKQLGIWKKEGATLDSFRSAIETLRAENATLKLRFANYDILRQTMLDVAHENAKLRDMVGTAKYYASCMVEEKDFSAPEKTFRLAGELNKALKDKED